MPRQDEPLFQRESDELKVVLRDTGELVLRGPGTVKLSSAGRLEIEVRVPPLPFSWQLSDKELEIMGVSTEGDNVFAAPAFQSGYSTNDERTEVRLTPFRCVIRNPAVLHTHWSSSVCTLKNAGGFGQQEWTDGQYRCAFSGLPHPSLKIQANEQQPPDITEAAHRALSLLSVAFRSRVVCPMEERYYAGQWVETALVHNETDHRATHPLIPDASRGAFMQLASVGYRLGATDYDLDALIGYYWRSHNEPTVEQKFMLAGLWMEALKFSWAKNVGRLRRATAPSGVILGFKKSAKKWYSFRELVDMTAADLGVPHSYTFIENRNALFHTGRPAAAQQGHLATWPHMKPELVKLHDQIDDLLLTILGYRGPIRPYWSIRTPVQFPGRAPL